MFLTGILQASGVALICVFFNVMIRLVNLIYDIEPVVVASVSTVAAALVLSLFAGPGKLVLSTLKTPATWIYGIAVFMAYLIDVSLTNHVSATEMSLFSRMAIPVAFLTGVIFFKKEHTKSDVIGICIVSVGLIGLYMLQNPDVLVSVMVLTFGLGIATASEVISAEVHSEAEKAQQSGNMRDKARVIGFVSVITSIIFLSIAIGGSILQEHVPIIHKSGIFPDFIRFSHPPSIWVGLFYGTFFIPLFRYLFWSASYKIKSDNVLAIFAFIPLLTFISEWILSFLPIFAQNASVFEAERGCYLVLISTIITFGSGMSIFLRVRKEIMAENKKGFWKSLKSAMSVSLEHETSIQYAVNAMDDYEIIHTTVEHAEQDIEKAAKLLDIPKDTLKVLLKGKGRLALTDEKSRKITRNYRNKVAGCDPLTGLLNRGKFMSEFKKSIENIKSATVMFIDLNEFKPVNDSHGHDAGDFILKEATKRIIKILPKNTLISRLGGDEFVIVIPNVDKKQTPTFVERIKTDISKPFRFKRKKIHIGASVGTSHYPDDSKNPEELLKIADKGMYQEKKER